MEAPAHYRRCHICGCLNVQFSHPILKCQNCHKSWAPFYYFNDKDVPIVEDHVLRVPRLMGEYNPIQGLTVYWESL